MPEDSNRQWTLAARPSGFPVENDFKLSDTEIPVPQHGELLIKLE